MPGMRCRLAALPTQMRYLPGTGFLMSRTGSSNCSLALSLQTNLPSGVSTTRVESLSL